MTSTKKITITLDDFLEALYSINEQLGTVRDADIQKCVETGIALRVGWDLWRYLNRPKEQKNDE